MLRDKLGRRASDNSEPFLMNNPVAGTGPTSNQYTQNDLNDDVFGSAPSSPALNAEETGHEDAGSRRHGAEHSDIPRLRSTHITNGYREGIAVSKEKYIQAGFDEGYSLGGEIGTKAGWCLGVLEGLSKGLKASKTSATGNAEMAEKVSEAWGKAQEELKVENLLGKQYFGPDGIWLYDVPGQDAEEEEMQVTFQDVAYAHPVLKIWLQRVKDLSQSLGVMLEPADEVA